MTFVGETDGLSSREALKRLRQEIEDTLRDCRCQVHGRQGWRVWFKDAFAESSMFSTFRWPSIVVGFFCAVFFVTSFFDTQDVSHLVQSTLVILVLFVNILVIGWDTKKYHHELHDKAAYLSHRIDELLANEEDLEAWTSGMFNPKLYLPHSPCISLQWTLRDGKTVNLPTVLLVKGDVIKLPPGNPAPGSCENIDQFGLLEATKLPKSVQLNQGDLFIPVIEPATSSSQETFSSQARFRKTVTPVKFVMKETIYLKDLKVCLRMSTTRPRSLYDKERHGILCHYIEWIITPLASVLLLIVCYIRYSHFRDSSVSWTELNRTLHRMSLVIFPLVPFSLPISWMILNALGVSRILHLCPSSSNETSKAIQSVDAILPTARLRAKVDGSKNMTFFDDVDTEIGSDVNEAMIPDTFTDTRSWKQVVKSVIQLLKNKEGYLWRSGNVVQALGSMTALCCVDKKGILSWPNPTADKVFFLTKSSDKIKKSSLASELMSPSSQEESVSGEVSGSGDKTTELSTKGVLSKKRRRRYRTKGKYQSKAQVLDVTHDPHSLFSCIEFDDPNWHVFLANIKPLGLAILLNTCNPRAQEEYTSFCDHISCQAYSTHTEDESNNVIPVVNKRCLCHLSRQIGFTDSAVKHYEYITQLTMYRHVRSNTQVNGKQLLTSLNIPRLKMPFPHVASSLIRDKTSNTYQLFSQGTGDLILDACSEYWDGCDLRILTTSDRKRILDFYHRSSLTAYCMAFSYVPLTSVSPDIKTKFKEYTLELTPDNPVHLPIDSLSIGLLGFRKNDFEGRESDSQSRISGHYLSNESLSRPVLSSPSKEDTQGVNNMEGMDAESIATQMNNQVFIGMVSMQYQACPDFVQLVEQLEKACIRFVHFSKENELRSRVFSEKMGLESGWNCHISLHSSTPQRDTKDEDKTRTENNTALCLGSKISLLEPPNPHGMTTNILRSQSAPCAVNLESSVVKFADTPEDSNTVSPEKVVVLTKTEEPSSSSGSSSSSSESETDPLQSKKDRKLSHESYVSPSPSRITDSTGTETAGQNAGQPSIAFDVLNRAKLPKGIENIRPHLKEVDNVPLLVSLFTDCTPEATSSMIEIMQDYGEVVCVLGSAANIHNMPIFLEANASIAIEPLYPEVCVTQPIFEGDLNKKLSKSFMSPTNLAKQLISLPCSLVLQRDDPIGLHRLIMESRTFMNNIRNSLQFLLCCSLSLSLVQLLGSLLFLPPLLTSGQVLWLVFLILPLISLTLMSSPPDPHVMTVATGKNLNLNRESVIYFLLCYMIKFTPSMLIIIFVFLWTLTCFCSDRDPSQGWDFFMDLK